MTRSELVTGHHLARQAIIYIRQSTPHQVLTTQEIPPWPSVATRAA